MLESLCICPDLCEVALLTDAIKSISCAFICMTKTKYEIQRGETGGPDPNPIKSHFHHTPSSTNQYNDSNEHPDMTIAVDWDVKHQTKPNSLNIL